MEKCPYHVDIITERVTRQFLITVSISRGLWTQQSVVQDTTFTRTVTKLDTLVFCVMLQSNLLSIHTTGFYIWFVWRNYIDHAKL